MYKEYSGEEDKLYAGYESPSPSNVIKKAKMKSEDLKTVTKARVDLQLEVGLPSSGVEIKLKRRQVDKGKLFLVVIMIIIGSTVARWHRQLAIDSHLHDGLICGPRLCFQLLDKLIY